MSSRAMGLPWFIILCGFDPPLLEPDATPGFAIASALFGVEGKKTLCKPTSRHLTFQNFASCISLLLRKNQSQMAERTMMCLLRELSSKVSLVLERITFFARVETHLPFLKYEETGKHLNPLQHRICAEMKRRQRAICMF